MARREPPPGLWLKRGEAEAYLGLSDAEFARLVEAKVLEPEGTGLGQRFDAEQVHAVGILWRALRRLMKTDSPE